MRSVKQMRAAGIKIHPFFEPDRQSIMDKMEQLLNDCDKPEIDEPYSAFWAGLTEEMLDAMKETVKEAEERENDCDLECNEEMPPETPLEDELRFICSMCGDEFDAEEMKMDDDVCGACRSKY
jgi:TRAP-type C4-dicarboxylate transport system substrate-binding protein